MGTLKTIAQYTAGALLIKLAHYFANRNFIYANKYRLVTHMKIIRFEVATIE